MKRAAYSIAAVAAIGMVVAGTWWWRQGLTPPPQPAPPLPSPIAAAALPVVAPAASQPAIKHPLDVPPAANPAAQPADVEAGLIEIFGRKKVLSLFQVEDFPRRLVATVDNLGRSHASTKLWPVNPAGGQFSVDTRDGAVVIAPDNGLRYTPYVLLIETVDMRQAVDLYRRFYPLFQQAYEDLGYPKRFFNDRLVEVIDQLLATPEFQGPLKVHLPPISGPVQPERPWVLYEFDDAASQSLVAGQKLLMRMGLDNERRVKARLAEVRRLVTAGSTSR